MFVARRTEGLPEAVTDAGKADGFIHVCEQAALSFGHDRRVPCTFRPVVAVHNDGPRFVVLPCTSQDKTDSPDFFALDDQHVMWSGPPGDRKSFAYDRYEVVRGTCLKKMIGTMPQPARIELLAWLKARY